MRFLAVTLDGAPPTAEELVYPALANFGHFTSVQVRAGAVRGLALHLDRLRSAHAELFGTRLDTGAVRRFMQEVTAPFAECTLRVTVFEDDPGRPRVLCTVRPAASAPTHASRLTTVEYVRPVAHLKHTGTFAQLLYGERAERDGFDDCVLVGPDGQLAETTTANLGFIDGPRVWWPDAPSLHGITWQLLDAGLARRSVPTGRRPVGIDTDLTAAFCCNSVGVWPVASIGTRTFVDSARLVTALVDAYDRVPWDAL